MRRIVLVALCLRRLWTATVPGRRAVWPVAAGGVVVGGAVVAHSVALANGSSSDRSTGAFRAIFLATSRSALMLGGRRGRSSAAVRARIAAALGRADRRGPRRGAAGRGPQASAGPGGRRPGLRSRTGCRHRPVYVDPAAGRSPRRMQPWVSDHAGSRGANVAASATGRRRPTSSAGWARRFAWRSTTNASRRRRSDPAAEDIRASRARIVEAGDSERRRLERDLHDGAQQRMLALSYHLRLARAAAEADGDGRPPRSSRGDRPGRSGRSRNCGGSPTGSSRRSSPRPDSAGARDPGGVRPLPVGLDVDVDGQPYPRRSRRRLRRRRRGSLDAAAARGATGSMSCVRRRRRPAGDPVADDGEPTDRRHDPRGRPCRRGRRPKHIAAAQGSRGDPMRVVVADDVMLTREGIARLLIDAGVEVVGESADADGLLPRGRAANPDVAVIDIRMPPTHTDEGLVAAQTDPRGAPGRSACSCCRSTSNRSTPCGSSRITRNARLPPQGTRLRRRHPPRRPPPHRRRRHRHRSHDRVPPGRHAPAAGPAGDLDPTRTRGPRAGRRRSSEPRHRRSTLRQRADRGDPRHADLPQAPATGQPPDQHRRVLAVVTFLRA